MSAGVPRFLHYVCHTKDNGQAHLLVTPRADTPNTTGAVRDAVLLAELEELTKSLEDVLDAPVDWIVANTADSMPGSDLLQLSLAFQDDYPLEQVSLFLSSSTLPLLASRQLAQLESKCDCRWRPITATLTLSVVQLTPEEMDKLHIGALLIIPESYQAQWKTTLDLPDGAYRVDGKYQLSSDTWTVMASDDDPLDPDTEKLCQVRFDCRVDPLALMQADTTLEIGLLDEKAPALPSVFIDGEIKYRGPLVPLGAGHALLIEQPAVAAA